MSTKPLFPAFYFPVMAAPQARWIGYLVLIILLHVFFFYALLNGWFKQAERELQKTEQDVPKEVIVSLISAENTPAPIEQMPTKPQPTHPKPVPVINKTVAPPSAIPVINRAPSEQAITTLPVSVQPPISHKPAVVIPSSEPAPLAPTSPAPSELASAAPAAPVPLPQPRTIVQGVEYLQAPEPEYPFLSRRMGEEGRVTLRVLVNEKGRPTRADILKTSGSQRLDEAARQAVLRAVFKPHIEDGRATTVYAIVPIAFNLDN